MLPHEAVKLALLRFINDQAWKEHSSHHIWPLVSNKAKEFLVPQAQWLVVGLSLWCAYSLRWYGNMPVLFQIYSGIFNSLYVIWQDTFLYDEASNESRGTPSITFAGMPHLQQLFNYWRNCVYQVHVIHTENSGWVWTINNVINSTWWGRNKVMKKIKSYIKNATVGIINSSENTECRQSPLLLWKETVRGLIKRTQNS